MNKIKLVLKKAQSFHKINFLSFQKFLEFRLFRNFLKLEIDEICFRVFLNNNRNILRVSVENYCQMALL